MMSAKILGLFNLPPLSTQPPFLSSAIAHGSQPRINNSCQGPILVRDFVTHVACMLQKCRNAGSRNKHHAPLANYWRHLYIHLEWFPRGAESKRKKIRVPFGTIGLPQNFQEFYPLPLVNINTYLLIHYESQESCHLSKNIIPGVSIFWISLHFLVEWWSSLAFGRKPWLSPKKFLTVLPIILISQSILSWYTINWTNRR